MSLIKKGILIGNHHDSSNLDMLRRHNVTHILCSAAELYPAFPGRFTYKHVHADDLPEFNIARFFDGAADFIHEGVRNGGTVLVHCAAGISRSVSLALAYLIKHEKMKLNSALSLVRSKRYIANPNPGFMSQLRQFERKLNSLGYRSTMAETGSREYGLYRGKQSNYRCPVRPTQSWKDRDESRPYNSYNSTYSHTGDYSSKLKDFGAPSLPTYGFAEKYHSQAAKSRYDDLANSVVNSHTPSITRAYCLSKPDISGNLPSYRNKNYLETPIMRSPRLSDYGANYRNRDLREHSDIYEKYMRSPNLSSAAARSIIGNYQSVMTKPRLSESTFAPFSIFPSKFDIASLRKSYQF